LLTLVRPGDHSNTQRRGACCCSTLPRGLPALPFILLPDRLEEGFLIHTEEVVEVVRLTTGSHGSSSDALHRFRQTVPAGYQSPGSTPRFAQGKRSPGEREPGMTCEYIRRPLRMVEDSFPLLKARWKVLSLPGAARRRLLPSLVASLLQR